MEFLVSLDTAIPEGRPREVVDETLGRTESKRHGYGRARSGCRPQRDARSLPWWTRPNRHGGSSSVAA